MNNLYAFVPKEDRREVAALLRVERFWSHVATTPDPLACWNWTAVLDKNGYGIFSDSGSNVGAHRVAFELAYGEIPAGLHIDHVCHSASSGCEGGKDCPHRRCVRPSHLEPVTPGDNVRRAIRQIAMAARRRLGGRTTCKNGHDWVPENIMVRPNGTRRCRQCHRDQVRRARLRKLGES